MAAHGRRNHFAEPDVTNRKTRLLLVRDFRRPTGGNLKVRDYFYHAACHPRVEARIWFAPESRHFESDVWSDVDPGQFVGSVDPPTRWAHDAALAFRAGRIGGDEIARTIMEAVA